MIRIGNEEELFRDAAVIRELVFVQEQGFREEFDEVDSRAIHAVLYLDAVPVATGRGFQDGEGRYTVGRIAVKKEYRGRGLGQKILKALETELKNRGAESIQLSAQTRVKGFYEKLGYRAQGEEYLDEFCPHVRMVKHL